MARRRDWIIGAIIAVAFLGFFAIMLIAVLGADYTDGVGFSGFGDRIALVDLEGPIVSSEDIVRQLKRWSEDESVRAILLRIDSPGGGVAASQEIYEQILRARDEGVVVVASMGSVAASGGLYVAMAADTIIANGGTLTGSIGVVLSFPIFKDLADKIGVRFQTIEAGEVKSTGNPYAEPTERQIELLQAAIDDTYEQFIEVIAKQRNLELDSVRLFADGRLLTGRQAHELKLVDILGTRQDALEIAAEMVGMDIPPKTVKERPRTERKGFWDRVSSALLDGVIERVGGVPGIRAGELYYLYMGQ